MEPQTNLDEDLSSRRAHIALTLLLVLASLYVFIDSGRPFNQTDDFWYAEIVSRMIEDGDYLVPRFGPNADFNKPPLFYWLSVPAVATMDNLNVAVRIVPGLTFLALCLLIYRMVARSHSRGAGVLSVAVFATTYDHLHNHGYKSGVPEGLLNLEMAAVLWLSVDLSERPWRLPLIAALCGAAFMTKTAFALFPTLLALPGLFALWRAGKVTPRLVLVSGLVGVGMIVPWFIAVLAREGPAVFDQMFLDQVLGRITNADVAKQTGRVFGRTEPGYALRHFFVWGAPWSLLVPVAGLGLIQIRDRLDPMTRRLTGLAGIWLVAVFAVMLASRASWGWYINSAYVPGALLTGIFLHEYLKGTGRVATAATLSVAAAGVVLLPTVLLYNPYSSSSGPIPLDGTSWVQLGMAIALTGALSWRMRACPYAEGPSGARASMLLCAAAALFCAGLQLAIAWTAPASLAAGWMTAGFATIVAVGLLALAPTIAGSTGRRWVLCSLMACALAYLIAPLQHLGKDNRRSDIRWMETQIRKSTFANGQQIQMRRRLYTYIRLYQSFHDTHVVEYEPDRQLLRLRQRNPASPGSAS